MKKEMRLVDEKKGIVQVTFCDERWYMKPVENKETGIPEYEAVPSVTFITQSYPKGIAYFKWLADKGWDDAEAIKIAAGDKGSKVHKAIEAILNGEEVRIDSKFLNKTTGQMEELTLEECDAIISFVAWRKELNPEILEIEKTIYSSVHKYAGTIDLKCKINGENWIIDFKTSQNIFPSHELQVTGYKQYFIDDEKVTENIKTGILQLGYRRNKNGYKFTEVDCPFDLFLATQKIWQYEHGTENPSKKDYPIVISPAVVKKVSTKKSKK